MFCLVFFIIYKQIFLKFKYKNLEEGPGEDRNAPQAGGQQGRCDMDFDVINF